MVQESGEKVPQTDEAILTEAPEVSLEQSEGEAEPAGERDLFLEAVAELKRTQEEQRRCFQKQIFLMKLCSGFLAAGLVVVCAAVLWLAPRVNGIMSQAALVLDHMEEVSGQLSQIDFASTAGEADSLLKESRERMNQTLGAAQESLEALGEIDVDGLNAAIESLRQASSTLSRLFGG